MRLFLLIKKMTFEEDDIEHNIINGVLDKEFLGYDEIIELTDEQFLKDTMRIIYKKDDKGNDTEEIDCRVFDIREKNTWWGFPLYELKDGAIVNFDYTQFSYFADTNRRNMLASKITELYHPNSELKIIRQTSKYIMDTLNIEYPSFFQKYSDKVEAIINRNPKN